MSWVFCAIVAGEAPAIRIYEDDDYLAILDIRLVNALQRAATDTTTQHPAALPTAAPVRP